MKNLKPKRIITTTVIAACAWIVTGSLITGCSKKNQGCTNPIALNYDQKAEEDDGSCVLAGKGGKDTLVAHPQHHDVPITGSATYRDTAYVKFNTLDFPGDHPSLYDLIVVGEKNENFVAIKRLLPGRYFIFMAGFDPSIGERVTGGIPVTVTQTYGRINIVVPVTE